jgi:ribosome biogenesis protein UTP30
VLLGEGGGDAEGGGARTRQNSPPPPLPSVAAARSLAHSLNLPSPPSFFSPLPHPIYRFEGAEVCLFVKDDPAPAPDAPRTHSAAKARAKAAGVLAKGGAGVGVSKIIGLSKLKQKYEPHEAKRALCRAFDLFLADTRVLPMLPRALGKSFFTAKKQPVPVELRGGPGRDWAAAVRKALDATYLHRGGGTCVNIRVGRTSQAPAEVAANAAAALAGALPHLVRGWSGVRSILLKLAGSAALPVYQSLEAAAEEEAAVVVGAAAAAPVVKAGKKVTA